jgi:oxalate decarboxylase/phosphoglucose isomerase-like protein (cupin superfamily)
MIQFETYAAHPDIDGDEGVIAVVLRKSASDKALGVQSLTPKTEPLQALYINYPQGHVIERHTHPQIIRSSYQTQEVLVIRKGSVKCELLTPSGKLVTTIVLNEGDVMIQFCGGHGFEMLQDTEIFEVKQGPYLGRLADKVKL